MTSEVVLMNRLAVAMAADSAVTIGDGQKIYQSAIKLFTLSKYHPVGVMVYNSASILGYPWETIIKTFRRTLGTNSCKSVVEYATKFHQFLHANEPGLFTPELQKQYVALGALDKLESIAESARDRILENLKHGGEVMAVTDAVAAAIKDEEVEDSKATVMPCFTATISADDFEAKAIAEYGADLKALAEQTLREKLGAFLSADGEAQLPALCERIAVLIARKLARYPKFGHYSGLVFAGFGDDEYLPSMTHITIGGVVCNHLKWHLEESASVAANGMPVIKPFAQSQMASTFMNGIDPELRQFAAIASIRMVREVVNLSLQAATELTEDRREELARECRKGAIAFWRTYQEQLREHILENHQNPLQSVIASLPKDDLADVAESMVSLNALKLRVSQVQETVAGPIDVAVISKGDGFVWIKRKHYFDPKLNPQFVTNYFRT